MVTKWLLHLAVLVCYSETVVSISRQEGVLQEISIRSTSGDPRCYIRIEMNPKEVESAVQQLSHHQKSPADFIHFPPDEKVTINQPATIILLYGNVAVLDVESQKNVLWYCRDATQYLVIDEGSKDERFIGWLIAGLVFNCLLYCPAQPPPDRTIPEIECPRDMHLYAPALETECTVSWTEPKAYDARDPDVATRRDPEWLKPGETLKASEWPYSVRYSATDASGNFNSCSFLITVSVIRCPHPTQQQHIGRLVEQGIMLVRFYPDTNDYNVLLGTTFVATCAYGYSLSDGSAQNMRTCTASGAWDGADVTCIKVQCEPLRPPFRGRVSCTDEYNFLSECTYSCDEGFDIPSGMNRVRVCTAAAEWTGNQPQCKDIMRPKIIDCPGPLIIEYLDMNEQDVSVVWDEPTVVDNADFSITAKISMGQPPGSSFTVGSHSVLYTATDRAGNEATPCELTVSVRAITCPVIHKKPYQLVSCPGGNSYGSRCEFSCEDGAQLIGTNFSYCIKEGDPPVGYWDWEQLEGSQPKCEGHPCRPLRVPQNGALACDTWLYGKHCTMLCNDQYDIPPDRDEPVRNSLWVCGSSGNWDYPDPPHCSEDKRPNSITLPSELQYFIGDCGTADTQEQIRLNFVQIFLESAFGFICVNLNCAVDDVNVICGETTGRKIADAPVNSSEPFVLTIKFDFALPISGDISVYEGEQVLYSLAEETERLSSSGNWTLKNLTGSDVFLNMKSFKPGLSEIQCPVGMEPRYNTLSCVGCSVGTFYNSTANQCQTCPIGSYQDESSQHSCKRCPYGQSTVSEGASNSTDCKHECKPGTFSSNGVQPCTPCNSGEYQPTRGQLSCISCQPATTTLLEGAVNASACENFDFQFPSQNQNHSSYVRYGDMEFKNSSGITVSFWFWFDKNCDRNASIFYYHCVDTASDDVRNESYLYPCLYMKSPHSPLFGLRRDNDTAEIQTGTTLRHETWHHVGVVYRTTNNTYTITVDGSVVTEGSFTQRQQHLQETINQRGSLWLGYHIADGEQIGIEPFAGFISNVNIWSHAKNELDLLDMAKMCVFKDVGDVLSWSQLGRAEQRKVSLQIPSLCDDTDECASAPCGDNQCVDQLRDYSCICKAGFTGQNCEINIDDCEYNVCQNNATCLDGVGNYTCLCPEGFVGDFCGVESVDGDWTPWSQWSSCSASCGGGNHSRTRECINPRPMHGGSNCTGPPFEIGACNTEKCPVCKNLTDPVNGFATCNSTDDEIHCTISCKPGFEFYDQPVLHYYCGQSTSYLWNHESPRNPLARYPPCSEATQPKALDMKHVMTYSNLSCNTKEIARLAKAEVNKTIQINVEKIECIKHKSCYVRSTTVENCLGLIGERHAVTVIIELSSISVADMETNNTDESHSAEKGLTKSIMNMESAAKQLKNMTINDAFTVFIDNEPYPVDNNATKTSGAPDCAIGEVAVMFYCVPCPVGTSFNNGNCVKCDIGTYQNETGQVNCITCPTGLTTEGFGAFDEDDCRVTETAAVTTDQSTTHAYAHVPDSKWISIGFGTAAALIFACLVAVCWLILKRRWVTKAQVQPSETTMNPSKKYIYGVDLGEDQGRHPTANQMKLRGDVFAWNGDFKCESKV